MFARARGLDRAGSAISAKLARRVDDGASPGSRARGDVQRSARARRPVVGPVREEPRRCRRLVDGGVGDGWQQCADIGEPREVPFGHLARCAALPLHFICVAWAVRARGGNGELEKARQRLERERERERE